MMRLSFCFATAVAFSLAQSVAAQQYSVEALSQAAPSEGVSADIAGTLSDAGMSVKRDGSRAVCEIWLCKSLVVKAGFQPSASVLYPLEAGQLIGLMRFPRKAEDFRGQEIPRGVYTVRYAWQPEDGNHVGTSDTRDFLLLSPVVDDQQLAAPDPKTLLERSASVAGSTHPAMLCLLKPAESGELPSLVHDDARGLWSLRCATSTAGDSAAPLVLQIVVVGKAEG